MNPLAEIEEVEQIQKLLSPAEKYYTNHLRNVSRYQKTHPEKMREKCNKYNARLREDPEKYAAALAKKRAYYYDVVQIKKSNKTIDSETLTI
jgi:hypothetical protein